MKMKQWERPEAVGQMFEPNEYVAACFSLACNIGPSGTNDNLSHWNNEQEYNRIGGPHFHAVAGTTDTCADANANRVITDNGSVVAEVAEKNGEQGWIPGAYDSWVDVNNNGKIDAGDTIYWHTFSTDKNRRWNHRGTLEALDASNPNHS